MAITIVELPAASAGIPAAAIILRVAFGLLKLGLTGFGREARIHRRTGAVRLL
jgi:hypothetical protein